MINDNTTFIKTWRLLGNDPLTEEDLDYISNCKLHIRTENMPQRIEANGHTFQFKGNGAVDVTTFNDEQEALFQLRFAGRFSLLNIVKVNSSWHSFNVQ
jgi:hypothetical protein